MKKDLESFEFQAPTINRSYLNPVESSPDQPPIETPIEKETVSQIEPDQKIPVSSSLDDEPEVEIASPVVRTGESGVGQLAETDSPSLSEIIRLGAVDSMFFAKTWFPKTFKMEMATFHPQMWAMFDNPNYRYINMQVMRDGAKTTMARAFIAKRISYGISRTIMFIGASQPKAIQSAMWLKKVVAKDGKGKAPTELAKTFGLRKGSKWGDEEFEIIHGVEEHSIWVVSMGITGSTRGVNFDDHRPDLILVDDCMNDINSNTPEQRLKIENLVLGALKGSLAPATEVPDAKMVLLNTPQDFEDFSVKALKDTQFHSARFGCWTPETENLALEDHRSSWEARYPTATLVADKVASIARNNYSTWAREKECKLVTPETSAFKSDWLQYFGEGEAEREPPLHEMWIEMAIDPVPPPTPIELAKGLGDRDYEAFAVVGRWRGKFYVLDTVYNRGHNPNWTAKTFFRLCAQYRPQKILVETVAYQATLYWLLGEAMKTTGRYYFIEPFKDKRKKVVRIKQGISDCASNYKLFIRPSQATLISQFIHFPGKNPEGTHDDVIEAVAVAITSLSKGVVGDVADDHYKVDEEVIPALEDYRGAP